MKKHGKKNMFSRPLIFLVIPKILLSVILFYNVLCVGFEALLQRTDGCGSGLEMSVYPVHKVLGQIGSKLWFPWQQKAPIDL